MRERDPDGDGLLTILLPDESGLDDSPKYDAVYGPLAHWKPGYARLVQRCRRARWSAATIARTTDEHVEDVLVNVAHALSLRALHRMTGDDAWDRARDAHRAGAARALLEREARPVLRPRRPRGAPGRDLHLVLAGAARARRIPREIRERLANEHLLQPAPLPRPLRRPERLDGGAELPPRLQRLPHLARRRLGQHRLAAGRRPARARRRRRGRPARRRRRRRGRAQRLPRVLPPAHRLRARRAPLRLLDAAARPPAGFSRQPQG